MATKTDAIFSIDILNKAINFAAKLLGFRNHQLDVKTMYAAFVETLLACAGSCFPGLENDIQDEYDNTSNEQKKVNYLMHKLIHFHKIHKL